MHHGAAAAGAARPSTAREHALSCICLPCHRTAGGPLPALAPGQHRWVRRGAPRALAMLAAPRPDRAWGSGPSLLTTSQPRMHPSAALPPAAAALRHAMHGAHRPAAPGAGCPPACACAFRKRRRPLTGAGNHWARAHWLSLLRLPCRLQGACGPGGAGPRHPAAHQQLQPAAAGQGWRVPDGGPPPVSRAPETAAAGWRHVAVARSCTARLAAGPWPRRARRAARLPPPHAARKPKPGPP